MEYTLDNTQFFNDDSSGVRRVIASGTDAFCYGTFSTLVAPHPEERYLQFKSLFSGSRPIHLSASVMRGKTPAGGFSSTAQGSDFLNRVDLGEDLLFQYKSDATGTAWQTFFTIASTDLGAGAFVDFDATFTPSETVKLRIGQEQFSSQGTAGGYYYDNWALDTVTVTGAIQSDINDFLNFNPMATDGIKSFPESASRWRTNGRYRWLNVWNRPNSILILLRTHTHIKCFKQRLC